MHIMELTAQEIECAIVQINARVREPYRCAQGDFPWLDDANLDSWTQALEQDGEVEIAAFFTRSGRIERVRRTFIECRPQLRELQTIDVEIAKVDGIGGGA